MLTGLLSLVSFTPRTTCPEMTLPSVDWTLPHSSSIEKILHRLAMKMGHVLN